MKWVFWAFMAAYAIALALLIISAFGLFGQERDPLGGVFLMPLGLPWNLIGDRIGLTSAAFAAGAPLINLAILYWLWKR
jgi:hypothetical protein